jgi:hypothetical protein
MNDQINRKNYNSHLNAADPVSALQAGVIDQAIRDAHEGDLAAAIYLQSPEVEETLESMGFDSQAGRRWVRKKKRMIHDKAISRKFVPSKEEPLKPVLALLPDPTTPGQYLVIGILRWDGGALVVEKAELRLYSNQFHLVIIDPEKIYPK